MTGISNEIIKCSFTFNSIGDNIKNALKSFITDNNIDDFIKSKICPDLTLFRESRNLKFEDTSSITFANIFKKEINLADKVLFPSEFDENNSVIEEEMNDNLDGEGEREAMNGEDEPIQDANSQNSYELNGYENFDNNQNNNEEEINLNDIPNFNKNNDTKFMTFRYEDLIERAGQFGTGKTDNFPEFNKFFQNFGKLEKNTFLNKTSILGLKNKKEGARKKKEEKDFIFNEENEIEIDDFFSNVKSKPHKKIDFYDFDDNRKKAKCFFHFDKLALFRMYCISGKSIDSRDIDIDLDIYQQERNLEENNQNNDNLPDNDGGEQYDHPNDIVGFEKNNENDNFLQNEKSAQKNFGKLYRKFDIRTLKKKIWISYEDINEKKIDFKNIVTNMSKNMNEDELFSISTPTCFVCLLHLCNEKNLFIEQKDLSTFYVENDINYRKDKKEKYKNDKKIRAENDNDENLSNQEIESEN